MKIRLFLTGIGIVLIAATSSRAATLIVATTDNFESGLGNWTTTGGARLYTFDTLNQPADDLTYNYAPAGNGAADVPKSSGTITLTDGLALDSNQFENVTIAFDYVWRNGSTTRRLQVEFSPDGGSNWFRLGSLTSGSSGGNKQPAASASVNIVEGVSGATKSGSISNPSGGTAYNGATFGDNSLVRFVDEASAGADVRVYIDNIVISGMGTAVPEPSAALLGVLGLLALMRRRR